MAVVVEVAGEAAAGVAEAQAVVDEAVAVFLAGFLVALNQKEALVEAVVDQKDGVLAVVRLVTLSSNGQQYLKTEPLPPSLWVEVVLLTLSVMEDMGLDHPVSEVHILLENPHTATGLQVKSFI